MATSMNSDVQLDNFDDIWSLGDPVLIENKFYELLPQAESLKNKSIYLQMLSQIALVQAMQQKFDAAHKTLDTAEALLTPEYELARARILLERGRVFQQSGNIPQAKSYFEQSFAVSQQNQLDFHTINAAHMIAIIVEPTIEKIKWNQLALELASSTNDKRAGDWLGSLYNNLGQNYLEDKQYEKALMAFQKALEYRKKEKYAPNIRVAKWAIAHTLRMLDRLDEALVILQALQQEYDVITKSEKIDVPVVQMFTLTRGWVYEELAEIYLAKANIFVNAAYDDLSNNVMFKTTSPERLERLKQLRK